MKFIYTTRTIFSDSVKKIGRLIILFILTSYPAFSQSPDNQGFFRISASRFTLPANTSGLTDPGFTIWGKFTKMSLGEKHYLYLTVRFEHSTANNPGPGFWYRYRDGRGNIYTDKEIGPEPFKSIKFYGSLFAARVIYGINKIDINLEGQEIPRRIGEVPKDFDIKNASVYVDELIRYNIEASAIQNAIAKYEQGIKDRENTRVQKEKQEAEAQKLAEQKEALAAREREQQSADNKETASEIDDFWSGTPSRTSSRSTRDENFRSASQFQGGLDDIQEGGYFKDDKGNYFKKVGDGARVVSESEYDRAQADKIEKQFALQAQRREERAQVFNTAINQGMDILTTSFYAQQVARGMKDASQLGGNFESIEELDAAFSQKISEISYMTEELRSASVRNMNTYTSTVAASATTTTDQTYATTLGVLGSVAASLSADNAAKKAREELNRQRAAEEAAIKERQREALVAVRDEISKTFPEGGMPLSSHKVDAPVLYVFAYSGNKTAWEKDQEVPLDVSNVIPVYRYNDGTYPYSPSVKRTFENGGIKSPILVGYFTDKRQAEKYRKSLLDVAPNAKFALNNIELKVNEKSSNDDPDNHSGVNFWGNKKMDSNVEKNNAETELDFWGLPTENKKTKTQKEETKNDFWDN